MDTLFDLAADAASLVHTQARALSRALLVVTVLAGGHYLLHRVVRQQAAQAVMFDQFARPFAQQQPASQLGGVAALREALGQ